MFVLFTDANYVLDLGYFIGYFNIYASLAVLGNYFTCEKLGQLDHL